MSTLINVSLKGYYGLPSAMMRHDSGSINHCFSLIQHLLDCHIFWCRVRNINEIERTFVNFIFRPFAFNKAVIKEEHTIIINDGDDTKISYSPFFKNEICNILLFIGEHGIKFSIEHQIKIDKYIADFVIMADKVKYVIEIDGHDFHEKTKEQVRKDKQRERNLMKLGYKVIRFTGSEVYNTCDKCWLDLFTIILNDNDKKGK